MYVKNSIKLFSIFSTAQKLPKIFTEFFGKCKIFHKKYEKINGKHFNLLYGPQQAWRDPNTKKITQRFWKRHFFYLYEHIHPPIFLNRALGGFWEKCISLFGADFQPIFTQPLPQACCWGVSSIFWSLDIIGGDHE